MTERNFGSIEHKGSSWIVRAEPHVATRLRRLFPKSRRGSGGEVILSDTAENAFELEWVIQRYPMRVECEERFRERIEQHRDRQKAIETILHDAGYTPPMFSLSYPPREYQRTAADMLLRSGHLLLGDEVGLGKTITAICTFCEKNTLPALVVCPVHLQRQWKSELAKFAPTLRAHILRKSTPYDLRIGYRGRREPFPDVIISSYHKLHGWADTLAGVVKSTTFDEAHELRRNQSDKYRAAAHIAHAAIYRMGLSATPVMNYGGEIHNILDVLAPDILGTREEFIREWCNYDSDRPRIREPKAMGTYLREHGLMLRRTREDVGRELPPLTKIPHHIDADLGAIQRLSASVTELAETLLAQGGVSNKDKWKAAGELDLKLRYTTGLAKAPYVADFVRMLVESGEQVVLFAWHHDCYAVWQDKLADLNPVKYTGRESPRQKDQSRDAFVRGDSKVLLMSLRSGMGLDGLQNCARTVVFGELDWSPFTHDQNIGRLHRDGQTDSVVAYYLIAEDGSDPVMADILGLKRQQGEGIRNPTGSLFETASDGTSHMKKLAAEVLERHGKKQRKAS